MKCPNVLVITLHDLGDYLPCYGTPVHAPNIDGIAREGVVFENHFSVGTVCSPSRGSLTTGCYPHTHGLMGLVHRGWELDVDRCPPLARLLGDAGYETHLFGFQHEHWDTKRLGYDGVHEGESHWAEHVTPLVTEWLANRGESDQPFFASVGFAEVHRVDWTRPSTFKRDVYTLADPAKTVVRPYLPDLPEVREDIAWFYGAITFADDKVGEILKALNAAGLRENTVVVFTTDHGASFMHSKATLYDGGTKVAMLMQWPGCLPAGGRVRSLTSHVDFLPTLFELIDVPVPEHVEGRSMASLVQGKHGEPREYVFAEKNMTNYFDPSRMARSDTHKYIHKGVRSCIFDFAIPEIEALSWNFRANAATFGFYSARRTTEELYDLRSDPAELNNLAEDPACQRRLDEMRAALDAHLKATEDPFKDFRNEIHLHRDAYVSLQKKRCGKHGTE